MAPEQSLEKGFFIQPPNTEQNKEKITLTEEMERIDAKVTKLIERLLHGQEKLIGKGMSAEVYEDTNYDICMKVTTRRETMGKNLPKSRIPVTVSPLVNVRAHLPKTEGEFLQKVFKIRGPIAIPEPIEWAVWESKDEGDTYFVQETMEILVMRTIKGVTLRDVLEGKESLPKNFDIDKFFKELTAFLEEMHVADIDRERIFHHDLHEGNVMIQEKNGSPAVIDFGHAGFDELSEHEIMNRNGKGFIHSKYMTDMDRVDKLKRDLQKYLTTLP